MSSFWWIDRTLPGVVASLIITAAVAASHLLMKRHVTQVNERQIAHIERLTADQTVTLSGGREQEGTADEPV
jgi:hypothetical protein